MILAFWWGRVKPFEVFRSQILEGEVHVNLNLRGPCLYYRKRLFEVAGLRNGDSLPELYQRQEDLGRTPQLVRVTESVLLWPVLIKYFGKAHFFLRNQIIKHVICLQWHLEVGVFRSFMCVGEKGRLISSAPSLWFLCSDRCKCQINYCVCFFSMCICFCFVLWLDKKLISKCHKWI